MADAQPAPAPLETRVRDVIDGLRPYIQADGGDIELVKVEEGWVHVRLKGACRGCPHAAMTLQHGVERHVRERVPEIHGVVNVP